jgi:ankyrin repeat protein
MGTREPVGATPETDSALPETDSALAAGIAAAKAGDLDALRAWLAAGPTVDRYDALGFTPLLWAAARGHAAAVRLLLEHGADAGRAHRDTGALPLHLAGQSGDVETVGILLDRRPDLIDAVYDVNGHTVLLQAVFYGHRPLVEYLLKRGADTSITTARGLGPLELAAQFENHAIVDLIRPYDSPPDKKAAAYKAYLARVAPVVPPEQAERQALSDELVATIEGGIREAATDPGAVERTLAKVKELIEERGAEVDRLGGPLQQSPLIVAATGNNGFPPNPDMARLRLELARYLLERGADPTLHEKHPMAVQTIIRAAVFNHLDMLKLCAEHITPRQLADAINEWPPVNGLTALHDTVLRASMAEPARFEGYLDQTRWFIQNGGRADIEDFSGRTQRQYAEAAPDPTVRQRLLDVLDGRDTGR